MKSRHTAFVALLFLSSYLLAQSLKEHPAFFNAPAIPDPSLFNQRVVSGRTQSVAVNPSNANEIVIATQFGGLWKTVDGASHWEHLDGLNSVFVSDVAYSPSGARLIATLQRDSQTVNGAGIYVSDDGGTTWSRSSIGAVPLDGRISPRPNAYGISFAPDDADRVYVGTDFGVAISSDGGNTWTHQMLETSSPVTDGMQNSAFCVQGLEGNRALALTRTGIYRLVPPTTWVRIRSGDFSFYGSTGCKRMDLSPYDSDKVFIQQDYNNILLYEVSFNGFSTLPLPGGGSRGPFVRVSRGVSGSPSFDVWVGCGARMYRRSCADLLDFKKTTKSKWTPFLRSDGVHEDAGHIGLGSFSTPVLYGSDGGIFLPSAPDYTSWTRASNPGSGMNSFLFTDIAGTDYLGGSRSLYLGTQDNGLWASPDNGASWPNNDASEGFHIEVPKLAFSTAGITVSYGRVGGGPSDIRLSDANFVNQRNTPITSSEGGVLSRMGTVFLVDWGDYVRYRAPTGANQEIYVSRDSCSTWRKRVDTSVNIIGTPQVSGTPPVVHVPVVGGLKSSVGARRIGLLRFNNMFGLGVQNVGESNVIYLPNEGSLGVRATEFDWQAVYGIDPREPNYIIAPDINNGRMMYTRNGGASWFENTALTSLVTKAGALLFYDNDGFYMQVTHIGFDTYRPNRVLIGTRDAGVIISNDNGHTWSRIVGSEPLLYCTGFYFGKDNTCYACSYGRGLWKVDFKQIFLAFPRDDFCGNTDCEYRSPYSVDTIPEPVDWETLDVTVVQDGEINGLNVQNGAITQMTVTPGSTYKRYVGPLVVAPTLFPIVESEHGIGFDGLLGAQAALQSGQKINFVVLEQGQFIGLMSSSMQFLDDEFDPPPYPQPQQNETGVNPPQQEMPNEPSTPYLYLWTDLPMPGLPVIGADNLLLLRVAGVPANTLPDRFEIAVDGVVVSRGAIGKLERVRVNEELQTGEHIVEVIFRNALQGQDFVMQSSFVKATLDQIDEVLVQTGGSGGRFGSSRGDWLRAGLTNHPAVKPFRN